MTKPSLSVMKRRPNAYEIRGDHAAVFLWRRHGKRFETLVDLADLERVLSFEYAWGAGKNSTTGFYYAAATIYLPERSKIMLHRFILSPPEAFMVDHINHDTLDNRRANLRIANRRLNCLNRRGAASNNTSGARGVTWFRETGKWRAQLTIAGKRTSLGYFRDKADAIATYNAALAAAMVAENDRTLRAALSEIEP